MMHGHDATSPPGLAASYGAAPARPPAPWVNPTSQVQCGGAWNVMTTALLQPRKATFIQSYSTITVSFSYTTITGSLEGRNYPEAQKKGES